MAAWRGFDGFRLRATLRARLSRIKPGRWLSAPRADGGGDGRLAKGRQEIPFPEPIGIADTPWLEPYPDDPLGGLAIGANGPDASTGHGSRYRSPSWPRCSTFRLGSVPPSCSATCSGSGPPRPPRSWTATPKRSTARCRGHAGQSPGNCRPAGMTGPRCQCSARECEVAGRFADAFERGDTDGIVALLTDDAWLTMPPLPFGYRGRAAAEFLSAARPAAGRAGSGLSPPGRTASRRSAAT